ncbi:hypothetical protein I551_5471 [Mycobacterium ulcerans str. Harvey]|uniref:Uncharacterized protein n=1 Tax=Mycobacterium ulcerans str. Harvey TaxID=1299332 RepID=A0ABN0QTD4_MYCUL|nr:hypothetical protein I551_5471 [Mycobacterium ulcerans str. Harvey]
MAAHRNYSNGNRCDHPWPTKERALPDGAHRVHQEGESTAVAIESTGAAHRVQPATGTHSGPDSDTGSDSHAGIDLGVGHRNRGLPMMPMMGGIPSMGGMGSASKAGLAAASGVPGGPALKPAALGGGAGAGAAMPLQSPSGAGAPASAAAAGGVAAGRGPLAGPALPRAAAGWAWRRWVTADTATAAPKTSVTRPARNRSTPRTGPGPRPSSAATSPTKPQTTRRSQPVPPRSTSN